MWRASQRCPDYPEHLGEACGAVGVISLCDIKLAFI